MNTEAVNEGTKFFDQNMSIQANVKLFSHTNNNFALQG